METNAFFYIFKLCLSVSCLAITSGILGIFLVLKKQTLVGDALSHSCFPGIILIYCVTNKLENQYLFLGAFIFSSLVLFLIEIIKKYTKKIKYDTILTLILSSFFGLGKSLLSYAQMYHPSPQIARLDKFFLGQAALIQDEQIFTIIWILIIVLITIVLFWKEFKLFIFNKEYAQVIGIKPKIMTFILNCLTIMVVVIGLQIMGVILISALIISPALIARHWSNHLFANFIIACFVCISSSLLGTLISCFPNVFYLDRLFGQGGNIPTGPIITCILSFCVFVSLLFSPKHGIIQKKIKHFRYKKKIIYFKDLIHLYTNEKDLNDLHKKDINSVFFQKEYLIYRENKVQFSNKGKSLVQEIMEGKI
ncbi:metal ABC transporter permease [Candidatus Phytoplasma pini]|uniref:metal ABC transporter permease n=1 Tax=Candidatus Phytoplasma pini TaxID=267362 RepID=UPI0011A7D541|nr:metal ABC transporter permease [Candidatus Phytoplasma pini]